MLRPGLSWGSAPPRRADGGAVADRYLQDQVEAASPAELTRLLFVEALRCMDTSLDLFAADQHYEALSLLVKAQAIVTELRMSLRPAGGDLSITLDAVYTWVYENLVRANTQRDIKALKEARRQLGEISEAWVEAMRALA